MWAPTIPEELPADVENELRQYLRVDFVKVPVIAPVIAAGVNEPELTGDILIRRIDLNMFSTLQTIRHPAAYRIHDGLSVARRAFEQHDISTVQQALNRVIDATRDDTANPFQQELSMAVRLSAEYVLRRVAK